MKGVGNYAGFARRDEEERILASVRAAITGKAAPGALCEAAVEALEGVPRYTWVGIYLVEGEDLVLRAWRGPAATEHTRIPIGKGVCGVAAASGRTELVNDVSKDPRYLPCFPSTKSEIVVPIKDGARVLGEIDIDADALNAFAEQDAKFLEKVALHLAAGLRAKA